MPEDKNYTMRKIARKPPPPLVSDRPGRVEKTLYMTDKPTNDETENDADSPDREDHSDDTLIVAPPSFRERVLAAQKARTSELRQSVEIPNPFRKPDETPTPAAPEDKNTPTDGTPHPQ
jgi:hypothetical protein